MAIKLKVPNKTVSANSAETENKEKLPINPKIKSINTTANIKYFMIESSLTLID